MSSGRGLLGVLGRVAYGMRSDAATVAVHQDELVSMCSGEPLSPNRFMNLYETRLYNVDSRRRDRKMLKLIDAPGVYVFSNVTRRKSFVGKGSKVFRRVFRQINGHGNQSLYSELRDGDEFEIRIFRLDRTDCDDVDELERAVAARSGMHYRGGGVASRKAELDEDQGRDAPRLDEGSGYGDASRDRRCPNESEASPKAAAIILIAVPLLMFALAASIWLNERYGITDGIFHKDEIEIPFSSDELEGLGYEEAESRIRGAGFSAVEVRDLDDLNFFTGLFIEEGLVEAVSINGDGDFSEGDFSRPTPK